MRTAKRKCANDDPSAPKGSFFNCMKIVKETPKYLTSCGSSVADLINFVSRLTNTVNDLNAAIAAVNAIIKGTGRFRHIRAVATTCSAFIDLVKSCEFHFSYFHTLLFSF